MSPATIDIVAVARARAGLGEAVRRWPHLVGPEAQERLGVYVEEQGEDDMARKNEPTEKTQIAVRLDADLIARLDAVAAKLSRPGLDVTRADAIRVALEAGLRAIEKEK
jgi:hypothetical protein